MKRCPALALLSNGGVPDLRKQIRPGLRERQVSPGRMLRDPAVRDGGGISRCFIALKEM